MVSEITKGLIIFLVLMAGAWIYSQVLKGQGSEGP